MKKESSTQVPKQALRKTDVSGRFRVSIREILEIDKRRKEIHKQELSNIDFIDDDGNIVEIEQSIINDFAYTGLNVSDFILTGFYKEGFSDT